MVFESPHRGASLALVTLAVVLASGLPSLIPGSGLAPGYSPARGSIAPTFSASVRNPPSSVGPSAGPSLTVDGAVPTAVSLSWTASGALFFTNYTVQQTTNLTAGSWKTVAVFTSASSNAYVATDLSPSSPYWWHVTTNSLGSSQTSPPAGTTTPSLPYLNVTLPTPTSARLLWTNNATYGGSLNFVAYDVYESASGGAATLVAAISAVTTHGTNLSGLSAGAGYAFFVNVTDCLSGCGTGSAVDAVSATNVVTVGTPTALAASLNAVRPVVDVNQSDLLTCTPSGGRSPYAISWDDGNGSWFAGPAIESFAFGSSGSPVVQCQIRDALLSSVVAGTALTVDPALEILATTNRSAADVGGAVGFDCAVSGGTAPVTVDWQYGDGTGASAGTATHAYGTPGHWAASCTATDFVGVQRVRSLGVAVSATPSASLATSSASAAPGTVLTFHGAIANGSGNASVPVWSFGDGSHGTGASVTHAFPAPGTYRVSSTSTDSNGVAATASVLETITNISANVTSALSFLTGTAILFSAAVTGGAGAPYNVTWSFGDGMSASGVAPLHVFTRAGAFQPTLRVTDRLGAVASFELAPVHAKAPPGPTPPYWLPLAGGFVALGVVVPISLTAFRRMEARSLEQVNRWVPPTDPRRTLTGTLRCRNCGTLNNAVREACSACGAPVSASLFD